MDEGLPGDTFNCRATVFARLATPIVPFMDNLYLDTFYFSVPLRLLWSNWERFNGAQDNPDDSTDYLVPTVTSPTGGWPVGSLSDYFGLPTGIAGLEVNSLWHRAYNLIFNEWMPFLCIFSSLISSFSNLYILPISIIFIFYML